MTRYCPYCNNTMAQDGRHEMFTSCSYRGAGLTRAQILVETEGYELGSLERKVQQETTEHNGAGCYDADLDMA